LFFFFQAEDGIRDGVTGVQTCALPIFVSTNTHLIFMVNFHSIFIDFDIFWLITNQRFLSLRCYNCGSGRFVYCH